MASPIIGLTAWRAEFPTYAGIQVLQTLEETYSDAIIEAGMVPIIIPNRQSESKAKEIVGLVDGLVLTGGDDVDPAMYGEGRVRVEDDDIAVDRFEVALVREAQRQIKPVLAICRGLQLLNVALGGTLVQDVTAPGTAHEPFSAQDDPAELEMRRHTVHLRDDSHMGAILGAKETKVNTLHHQGIATLAPGLIVEGTADDGLIEAARYQGTWWALGVQWHPERMHPGDRDPLFEALRRAVEQV